MSDETILIWFRLSTKIKHAPVTVSAHSNWGIKFFIFNGFSIKDIIPRSASAAARKEERKK